MLLRRQRPKRMTSAILFINLLRNLVKKIKCLSLSVLMQIRRREAVNLPNKRSLRNKFALQIDFSSVKISTLMPNIKLASFRLAKPLLKLSCTFQQNKLWSSQQTFFKNEHKLWKRTEEWSRIIINHRTLSQTTSSKRYFQKIFLKSILTSRSKSQGKTLEWVIKFLIIQFF